MGFTRELEAAVLSARRSRLRLAGLQAAALDAFEAWARGLQGPPMIENSRAVLAMARQGALSAMLAAGRQAWNTWDVQADPSTLSGGACYPHQKLGEPLQLRRAFELDTAASVLRDAVAGPPPADASACGWTGPVCLSLGTFPYVYGGQLGRHAPGLSWPAEGRAQPAATAMRAAAAMWTPLGNLRQDARVVAVQARLFRERTEPLLAELAAWEVPGRPRPPGRLYRRGGLLHVEQGSLELATLEGPFGVLAASAYNAVRLRHATFFALRRAVLRARAAWTPEMRDAAARNPDPCLRLESSVREARA